MVGSLTFVVGREDRVSVEISGIRGILLAMSRLYGASNRFFSK